MKYPLDINAVYNVALYAPAVLGATLKNATLVGILDYSGAMALQDVSAIHASVLSQLPPGTPSNPSGLVYLKFKTDIGVRVIAMDWISTAPEIQTTKVVTVNLQVGGASDVSRLREVLIHNGFSIFEIIE